MKGGLTGLWKMVARMSTPNPETQHFDIETRNPKFKTRNANPETRNPTPITVPTLTKWCASRHEWKVDTGGKLTTAV